MNFLSMDYFITLARERNFTRAAEKLHITQQTLSAHISNLEKETGAPLFLRHVPLELTYAGRIFYRYAQEFQRTARSLKRELDDIATKEAGELRIGTSPVRENYLLPELITGFRKQHPLVSFHLIEAANQQLHEKLRNGEIDLAIANFPKRLPGIELIPYYEEEVIILVASKLLKKYQNENTTENGERLPMIPQELPEAIRACPFLLNSKKNIAGQIARHVFEENYMQPTISIESDNMVTLINLCFSGNGAMFCPENLARNVLNAAQLREMTMIRFPQSRYTISFGCRKEPHRWSMLDAFISFSRSHSPAAQL